MSHSADRRQRNPLTVCFLIHTPKAYNPHSDIEIYSSAFRGVSCCLFYLELGGTVGMYILVSLPGRVTEAKEVMQ